MIKRKNNKFIYTPTDLLTYNESRYTSYLDRQGKLKNTKKKVKKNTVLDMVKMSGIEFEIVRVKNYIEEVFTYIQIMKNYDPLLPDDLFENQITKKLYETTYKEVTAKTQINNIISRLLLTINVLKDDHLKAKPFKISEKFKFQQYQDENNIEEDFGSFIRNKNNFIKYIQTKTKGDLDINSILKYINKNQMKVKKKLTINRIKKTFLSTLGASSIEEMELQYNPSFYDETNLYVDLTEDLGDEDKYITSYEKTKEAMDKGIPIIIQGCIMNKDKSLMGLVDILIKIPYDNERGYIYEVKDIKRSNVPKSKFVLQICAYSDILHEIQGVRPLFGDILLGNNTNERFKIDDFYTYYLRLKNDFFDFHNGNKIGIPELKDKSSKYKEEALLDLKDGIEGIANISNDEIVRLRDHKINTKKELIKIKSLDDFSKSSLNRLRMQAKIEIENGSFQILQQFEEGFDFRDLDTFNDSDVYLDIKHTETLDKEGFVCFYNLLYESEGQLIHKTFEAPTKKDEESAFISFMFHLQSILKEEGKIYYFSPRIYTQLVEVAAEYNKFIGVINRIFFKKHFINIQELMINSIVINIPDYSLENIASILNFNSEELSVGFETTLISLKNNVKSAYDFSIRDRAAKDLEKFSLSKITFFNTLHLWLVQLRDENSIQFTPFKDRPIQIKIREEFKKKDEEKIEKEKQQKIKQETQVQEIKDKIYKYEKEKKPKLLEKAKIKLEKTELIQQSKIDKEKETKEVIETNEEKIKIYKFNDKTYAKLTKNQKVMTLMSQLVHFHSLESDIKRIETQELMMGAVDLRMKSLRCLNNLKYSSHSIFKKPRSEVFHVTYVKKNEDSKIKEGDTILIFNSTIRGVVINSEDTITIEFKDDSILTNTTISVCENNMDHSHHLSKTIAQIFFLTSETKQYCGLPKPIYEILSHTDPNLHLIDSDLISQISNTINNLDQSYLIIQGPPGTGKSYTASEIIKTIVESKPNIKIGISSNSHKAIDGLLASAASILKDSDIDIFKHLSGKQLPEELQDLNIKNSSLAPIKKVKSQLNSYIIGGTAYSMRNEELDYLFIDEAGQVSLANLVAMGSNSKNIIIIGDQQQLEQPIQAVHSGDSGKSILEYCLGDNPIVPKTKGFFLPISRRMRSDLCKVVSKYFYNSELESIEDAALANPKLLSYGEKRIKIELEVKGGDVSKNYGVQFINVQHKNNTQYSIEEVDKVESLVSHLLTKKLNDGESRLITKKDIIIVSPYNLQVSKLKKRLGDDMLIGSVDLFQGQEAPIVIFSLGASQVSSRGLDFLLNPNRMNVALSRGKALAIIVGSEELLSIPTDKMEELKLLNMFTEITKLKV